MQRLAELLDVLSCDAETAREYGRIKVALQAIGRMIPDNDIWIAATALQHGLILATRDQHFEAVENLASAAW